MRRVRRRSNVTRSRVEALEGKALLRLGAGPPHGTPSDATAEAQLLAQFRSTADSRLLAQVQRWAVAVMARLRLLHPDPVGKRMGDVLKAPRSEAGEP